MSAEYPPELIEKKSKLRAALRKEYLKQLTNPHKEPNGHIFDPAVQRFMAMKATRIEFFRETPSSVMRGIAIMAIPFAITFYYISKGRRDQEARFRSGEVSYKDRLFKFI